jgi:SpoVK/Ycf46/Vps4 family AAA+-type ATPase
MNPPDDTIITIVNSLTTDAQIFYSKANTYRDYAELDGCLINLTLAANNLYQAITILNNHQSAPSTEINVLKRGVNNYLDIVQCSANCKPQLETILRHILEEIRPLQQKLRSQKNTGSSSGSGGKDANDIIHCDVVKEVILEGKENCIDFTDVVGCESAKDKITESFINPFIYPNLFRNRANSILFYGPPGTGKTMIVKAAINELKLKSPNLNIHFFAPLAADLKGKYVGETEKKIKTYFDCASLKACQSELDSKDGSFRRNISILFLDEIEALAGSRGGEGSGEGMTSSVNMLLQMMDGVSTKPNLVVIGATNYPWKLDGAILRRFSNRIFIDLPKKEDIIKLIFMEYAGFIEVNKDETIGKYDTDKKQFVEDEENGSLLLKIKKGKGGKQELYDDIDNHCDKLIREKEDEDLQLDTPKQTQKESFCFEMLKERREESIEAADTYSDNIIDKKSYKILFNDEYISLLSYGLNFIEVSKELLRASSNIDNLQEYINKKRDFVYKRLVLDVSALADIMVSKLFSNSDIRTFMRDRYFPLLSYESLKNEKKRYVVKINERTFHVDTRSLDMFSPLINNLPITQQEDEYGNLTNGSEAFQKYTDIKYSDLFQLEKSSYFDMYWVQPSQLAKMEFNKEKKETVAIPKDCVDLVNSTFLKATGDDGAVIGNKSSEMYEKSTDLNLFVKLKDKGIFIETQYKYLCNLQVSIQSTFDEIYTNVKWYFNKESNSNQDYFQKVTSLSIPDVSGINTKKIKTFKNIEELTKIDQKGGSRWSSIKKFFTGSYWSGPWPRLRKLMYFFKSSTEDLQKEINKEYFEEEMRIEEFRKKEYENLLFENQEKESKDYMSKILMNELNLKNIFFTEEQKCLNLNRLCVKLIERMPVLFKKMSYLSAIEMKYFEIKFNKIQLEDDEFSSKSPSPNSDQLRAHTEMIEKKRMELRQLIRKNFQIDRIIAKAVEQCLKSSPIQSYEDFKTSFAHCFMHEVNNIAYLSVLFPSETNDEENSAASIFVIEKSTFQKSPISSVVYIPVWSGIKTQLQNATNNVLNCSIENSQEEITNILRNMTDKDEYIVYYKFQAGDNLNKFKSELTDWITELFSKAKDDVDDDADDDAADDNDDDGVGAAPSDDDDADDDDAQTDKFNWNKCCLPYKLKIDKIEKSTQEIVPENPKLFRTFQINPRYSIITLLDETKKDSYFQASTIKSDYAEMKYYEDTRIAPDTKERKKKAYKEMAAKYEWAKDLKIEE